MGTKQVYCEQCGNVIIDVSIDSATTPICGPCAVRNASVPTHKRSKKELRALQRDVGTGVM